jgi:hypothetical protein
MTRAATLSSAILCIVTPARLHADTHHAPVRPRAQVRVEIASKLYRIKLDGGDGTRCGATCSALETALTTRARTAFDARYRFVDWRASGEQMRDTIVVRLRERPRANVEMVVTLNRRAPALSSDSVAVYFDDFLAARSREPSYWDRTQLQKVWADTIEARLDAHASRVISLVIGRLPLLAPVNFPSADSSSRVDVSADSLRAALQPPVSFLVRVVIASTRQRTVYEQNGELRLNGCVEGSGAGQRRYVCRKLEFILTDPVRESANFFAVKASADRITTKSVHLYEYTSAPRNTRSSGLVIPADNP